MMAPLQGDLCMVVALARLIVVGFVVLTVIYLSLSFYSRSVRRAKLRRKWDEDIRRGDREEYVRRGLKIYDRSLRRKLLWGVYILPVVTIAVVIYLVNFN
jgi:hypothetical protein